MKILNEKWNENENICVFQYNRPLQSDFHAREQKCIFSTGGKIYYLLLKQQIFSHVNCWIFFLSMYCIVR